MSFWGLILEPKKSYSQRGVEQPFHISSAALDLQTSDDGPVSVVCRSNEQDFVLCSLSKKQGILNVPLNLDFELGAEINFHVIGNSTVHLTGYIVDDVEFDDDSSMDELEEEEAENEKGAVLKNTKKLLDAASKRKPDTSAQNKSKKAKVEVEQDEDDDDEEDDSDFDMEENIDGEEELGEEEEDDDEEDDDDEDDDDEDEDDDGEAAEVLKKLQAIRGDKSKQGKNQEAAKAGQNAKQGKKEQPKGQNQPNKQNGAQTNGTTKKVIAGGIQVEDMQIGNGAVAGNGKQVAVYYAGRLKTNNKQFDACQSGPGFKFRLGKGEVIKGWDLGVAGMKVGGKRRLTIPAKMAYGKEGAGKTIPPNSTLVFDVELRHVK